MQKLKITIVLPHLKVGGTERTAVELANYIARNKSDVTLLLMYKNDNFYKLDDEVHIIEPSFLKNKLGSFFYVFNLLFFLRAQLKKQNPDIIFALGYIAFTLFSSVGLPAKVVVSFRSSPNRVRFPNNKLLNISYKIAHYLLKGRVNGIIAQTSQAAEFFKKSYKCPVATIPNFLRKINHYNLKRKDQIINVGHCSFEKGQHFLIQAFSKLNAPDWKLVIVGDGPKRKELEKLAEELNLINRVVFLGYQKDVDFFLSQSSIFAFTSIIEGYPNALIEAMAIPLPPVSFNCVAGPADIIIDGENGFLVNVGDVETFTQRLQQLIEQPELREKIQNNAIKVREKNHLDNIVPRYLEFFYQILEE